MLILKPFRFFSFQNADADKGEDEEDDNKVDFPEFLSFASRRQREALKNKVILGVSRNIAALEVRM